MKAAWYERNGPADSVLEIGDKPTPRAGKGEVLVKLATSGVNPSDVKTRAGRPVPFDFQVPHSDGAGVIEAVGEGVDTGRKGERVWLWNGAFQRQYGTAAEYIAVPEVQAVPLSGDIDFETAACFGIPGLTAAHAVNLLEATSAGTVLVTGAAASVGHYVTQMAAQMGRKVIGTASAAKQDIVLSAGAIACIDYQNEDVGERVAELTNGTGAGAVIDLDFSSTSLLVSSPGIANNATVFSYGSNDMGDLAVPFRHLLFKSITLQFFLVYLLGRQERIAAIDRLGNFMASGHAVTRIARTFPLPEVAAAHELVESGKANGNVVVTL